MFSVCHLFSSLFLPSLHPPHPSLNFWLSRTSRRQGHLTAVAVETENWGFFPLPPFSCAVRRRGIGWWGAEQGEKHEVMTEVKKGYWWQPFWFKCNAKNFISSTGVTKSLSCALLWANESNSSFKLKLSMAYNISQWYWNLYFYKKKFFLKITTRTIGKEIFWFIHFT